MEDFKTIAVIIYIIAVVVFVMTVGVTEMIKKDMAKEICDPYVVETYNKNVVVCKSTEGHIIKEIEKEK